MSIFKVVPLAKRIFKKMVPLARTVSTEIKADFYKNDILD